MLSLGRDEALNFVTEKLGVGEVERKFVEDKLSLLNEMISAFHHNVPFQTLTLMAVSPDIRQIPSADEIKADLFSGKGGKLFHRYLDQQPYRHRRAYLEGCV